MAAFYFLSFISILTALMVVFSKNPIYSVIYLILCFFSLTGHYVLLNAQFVGIVNAIVYAGAIMVLFLFVIMFLNLREGVTRQQKSNMGKIAAALAAGMLLTVIVGAMGHSIIPGYQAASYNSQVGMVNNLGMELYTNYLVPFELASVLFLVAMTGAVMLGKREEGERNTF